MRGWRQGRLACCVLAPIAAGLLLSCSQAAAAPSVKWKFIDFVFDGQGRGAYTYAPKLVGKSQKYQLSWTIVWRLEPNQHAKLVSEKVTGKSSFKGTNKADDCSGDVSTKDGAPAQMLPTGIKGVKGDKFKYSLLGAQVPLFQNVVLVTDCAGRPGYGLASTWGHGPGDESYFKHRVNVAEVALDYKKPRSETLRYPSRGGTRKTSSGESFTVSWSGTVEVRVNGAR